MNNESPRLDELRAAFENAITHPPYEKSVERFSQFGAWPGNYRDIAVDLAWCMWLEASRAVRAEPERYAYPGDRKLLEALDRYINPVLQELQFERGTGSLAAHNLRLCLIEVGKALKGERERAETPGVGFPLQGVSEYVTAGALATHQPQAAESVPALPVVDEDWFNEVRRGMYPGREEALKPIIADWPEALNFAREAVNAYAREAAASLAKTASHP